MGSAKWSKVLLTGVTELGVCEGGSVGAGDSLEVVRAAETRASSFFLRGFLLRVLAARSVLFFVKLASQIGLSQARLAMK